jgi:hypothetical protein
MHEQLYAALAAEHTTLHNACSGKIKFFDISQGGLDAPLLERGVVHGDTVRRLHLLRHSDRALLIGAPTFFELWRHLPGFRWLAPLGSIPGVTPATDWLYGIWADYRLGITSTKATGTAPGPGPGPGPAASADHARGSAPTPQSEETAPSVCSSRASIGRESGHTAEEASTSTSPMPGAQR